VGARAAGAGVSAMDPPVPAPRTARPAEALVARYLAVFPGERAALAPLLAQLALPEPPDDRGTLPGHLTAAALVLHPVRPDLLLVRHRALQRWLQPGGHLERGELPLVAARREAEEETGARGLGALDWHADGPDPARALPLDIDVHPIPARPERGEPAHLHLDFRYAFRLLDAGALARQVEEVDDLRWHALADLAARDLVPGLTRAARKLLGVLHA